jgi:hypothetical protein
MKGSAVAQPTVRVRIPVTYGEEVRYVLSAPLNLKHLSALLEAQQLPEGWLILLVDREKQVIVRRPEAVAGTLVNEPLREAIEHAKEGWVHGLSLDGKPVYGAYVTSPLSGWVLTIGIPAEMVEEGERRTYGIIGIGFVVALVLGAFLAWRGVQSLTL